MAPPGEAREERATTLSATALNSPGSLRSIARRPIWTRWSANFAVSAPVLRATLRMAAATSIPGAKVVKTPMAESVEMTGSASPSKANLVPWIRRSHAAEVAVAFLDDETGFGFEFREGVALQSLAARLRDDDGLAVALLLAEGGDFRGVIHVGHGSDLETQAARGIVPEQNGEEPDGESGAEEVPFSPPEPEREAGLRPGFEGSERFVAHGE
jgi:hypothetical protein